MESKNEFSLDVALSFFELDVRPCMLSVKRSDHAKCRKIILTLVFIKIGVISQRHLPQKHYLDNCVTKYDEGILILH